MQRISHPSAAPVCPQTYGQPRFERRPFGSRPDMRRSAGARGSVSRRNLSPMIGAPAERRDAAGRARTLSGPQVMIAESRLLARDMPSFW